MRAETTIKAVESIAKVSRKGKRINGLFRLLGNPEVLWKQAYINLYTNKGAVTKGTTSNTLDGFSMDRVNHLIRLLYAKEYHFKPVRRTYTVSYTHLDVYKRQVRQSASTRYSDRGGRRRS